MNTVNGSKSLEKLSSGLRINRAGDDAAGLAISEKMRGQIRGLDQAARNAQDGISMIQTAEGALAETHAILQRMRELAVQSSNDSNTNDDRAEIQNEITQLKEEIDRIGNTTEFNTQKLLDGTKGAATTSANLTGGDAIEISETGALKIVDATETKNNRVNVVLDVESVNGGEPMVLTFELAEKNYDSIVDFTNEFNTKLAAAIEELKTASAIDYTNTVKNHVKLGFDVDTSTGDVTFQLEDDGQLEDGDSVTIAFETMHSDLAAKLGMATDLKVTNVGGNPTTQAADNAVGAFSTWKVKIEDGLSAKANQNNEIKMSYDGMNITGYVAEGEYTDPALAADALKNAILGVAVSNANMEKIISGEDGYDGTNWAAVVTAAETYGNTHADNGGVATGLVAKVDALDADTLNALGYNGSLDSMKEKYMHDLIVSDADPNKNLNIRFNENNKLEITSPKQMEVDETSDAAIEFGLTDVNADLTQSGITFQIGANAAQTMVIGISDMRTTAIGKTTVNSVDYKLADIDVSTKDGAQVAIQVLDTAIKEVSSERSKLGAYQNRLEHTINNLGTSSENLTASESRIRDVDMAKEMMEFTKNNILSQAAQAMLAQANQQPQGVLQLLR
jgi:flagellin